MMLENLVDISYLKSLLGYSYKDECSVLNYLISLYKTTESYYRSLALGLPSFEFTTSSEIYSLLGLERLEYTENMDSFTLYGNTDILIKFPHMMDEFRVEELCSLDNLPSLYIHFKAFIHSLGSNNLSVLKHNYKLSCDSYGALNLSHGLDLNYLYMLNNNHVFSDRVLLDFYVMNQHLFSISSYLYDYDTLSRFIYLFNGMLYDGVHSLDEILKSSSLNPFMDKDLSLYIDIYSNLPSFYTSDIESFVLLKSYFHNIILTIDLVYINDKVPVISWLSDLKSLGINIVLKGDSVGLLDFLDIMLRGDDVDI